MMECSNCHNGISTSFPDTKFNSWVRLINYFQHELDEHEITETTYERMVDSLMSLKPEPDKV